MSQDGWKNVKIPSNVFNDTTRISEERNALLDIVRHTKATLDIARVRYDAKNFIGNHRDATTAALAPKAEGSSKFTDTEAHECASNTMKALTQKIHTTIGFSQQQSHEDKATEVTTSVPKLSSAA